MSKHMKKKVGSHTVSLAVLPFDNFSGKHDYDYFVLGFVEELIVDLSHFAGLQLISSYTSTRLGNDDRNEVEEAKKYSINYLLKGSLLIRNKILRITTQLLDTSIDKVLWAERYDAPAESVFDIQDDIVERVVSAISLEVDHAMLATAHQKPLTNLATYDCWLRGMHHLRQGSLEADKEARQFFDRALAIDPQYSRAYAGLSLSHFNEWSCQLWELYEQSEQSAYNYAVKALQLDYTDHIIQVILGRIYLFRRQFDEAAHHLEKSLALNSNDADSLVQLSTCMTYLGRAAEGERLFKKAVRLNPYRNLWYYQYGSFTYFVQKRYEISIEMALKRQITNAWVDLPGYIAAAYAHLNDNVNAKKYLAIFIDSFQEKITKGKRFEAGEIIDWVKHANPFKYEEDTQNVIDGLVLAGLEGQLDGSTVQAVKTAPPSVSTPSLFIKEKEIWKITFEGNEITLADMKGLHDITRLLSTPDEDIHCTELMGSASSMDENDFTMDDKAHRSYKQRMQDLNIEIEEADELNDLGRKAKLEEELDQLIEHLSQSLGIGKRPRKLKSPSERARSAVTLRIKSAIKKINASHPSLGKHLSNSIRTGVFCCYSPEEYRDWILP